MNRDIQENTTLEVPWVTLSVDAEYRVLLEDFCDRNQIPCEIVYTCEENIVFSVRDGIDSQDVVAYILRKTLVSGDEETIGLIHMLFQRRLYWRPQYEYEFSIYRTKEDDGLLMSWDYPL